MPSALSYPGVYIEEVPSGVRTITGVATSITAFIGRARRGPVNKVVTITSPTEYVQIFGGPWTESTMGTAVADFYRNGGAEVLVVRLYEPDSAGNAPRATINADGLSLEAAAEGAWGDRLLAEIGQLTDSNLSEEIADGLGVSPTNLFQLSVEDPASGITETHLNLTVVESARRVDRVLAAESRLVRVAGDLPDDRPGEDLYAVVEAGRGSDGAELVEDNYIAPEDPPDPDDPSAPYVASIAQKRGLYALEDADLVNLLCIPPFAPGVDVTTPVWAAAAEFAARKRALLIVDPPFGWNSVSDAVEGLPGIANSIG
ncbi:MAG: phage tail sheath family protein, partial [Thiohalocapsa sp.]